MGKNASPNWNNIEKGGCCEWEILKWYGVFSEAGSETDQMRRVRERSWKDDSLGSPLSWVARCEGRCCREGLPKRWEGNHRPMQENFGRERIIPQSHMLWGSVVKGGLKMPLAFTSKEVIRDPGPFWAHGPHSQICCFFQEEVGKGFSCLIYKMRTSSVFLLNKKKRKSQTQADDDIFEKKHNETKTGWSKVIDFDC